MAETREYPARWLGVWRADNSAYVGGVSPIRVGGSQRYNSFIGFYPELKQDIQSSKIPVTVKLRIYATNGGEFDIGMHRQSANKAASGLPDYEYSGLHPVLPQGVFQEINMTNFPANSLNLAANQPNTFVGALNSGYEGITLYGGSDYGEAYGATRNGYEVKLLVTGEWNVPPSIPQITYPNGGETIAGVETLKATPSTDPEQPQSQLRYQWGIYDGSWHYFWTEGPGITDLTINFDQFKETSVAQVALRAFDSAIDYEHGAFGNWDYSDGVFSIRHNVPPTTPTELVPANGVTLDRSEIQRFGWVHNDDDPQSRFELRWREQGTATWNSIVKDTPNEYHYLASDVLPNANIEWQVRTYDQQQLVSPWSSLAVFFAADPSDKPVILSPIQDDSIPVANPVVQWSSVDQQTYDLEVWNGTTLVWEMERASTNKAQTIDYSLANNTTYEIRLRIQNTDGLWSAYDSIDITTSFRPPEQANILITNDSERGSIIIGIENPANSNVNVVYNKLYRRIQGETDWLLIAEYLPPNFYFTDFTPASGVLYEYMVETWGDNGTYSNSVASLASIMLDHAQLSMVSNPDMWVLLKWNPSKSVGYSLERVQMKFNKRVFPVSEFGVNQETKLDLSYSIRNEADLQMVVDIVNSKEVLLYRDARGQRDFVTIDDLKVEQFKQLGRYNISFTSEKVDFREGLE